MTVLFRPRPADRWCDAGVEPFLVDLLADPLIHLVLRRDGLTRDDLERVIVEAQGRLRRGLCRRVGLIERRNGRHA